MARSTTLRVAIIAPFRFPIVEPFVGGLEAQVWLLARLLRERGHHVTLFAAHGCDPRIADRHFPVDMADTDGAARRDVSGDPTLVLAEDRAYRRVMHHLIRAGTRRYDIVHNHSLHPFPMTMSRRLDIAMISTLHTPPIERVVESVSGRAAPGLRFVGVSRHTADSWAVVGAPVQVILNGVDVERWRPGPGGGPLVWSGRLVPEKGPELAIDAARRAGRDLDLAGPIIDRPFFDAQIAPRLGSGIRYLGHLDQQQLATVVGRATAALVTPRWDEPYGLVAAEALACGTPVAAFERGGLPEVLTSATGCLARPDDAAALADAVDRAVGLSRRDARRRAVRHLSARAMVDAYEGVYRGAIAHVNPPEFAVARAAVGGDDEFDDEAAM